MLLLPNVLDEINMTTTGLRCWVRRGREAGATGWFVGRMNSCWRNRVRVCGIYGGGRVESAMDVAAGDAVEALVAR